jgi:hypothetical protein
MKHKLLVCAGWLALSVATVGPAASQGIYPPATGLPPHEIVAIVRSTGLEPLSRPVRHGPNYALHAVDPTGRPVRVVVDAKLGRIVGVAPAANARFGAPAMVPGPGYVRPQANVAAVPDGYGPGARLPLSAPGAETPYGPLAGRERLPVAPGRIATATPEEAREGATPLPLPRPRPKFAAADAAPAANAPAPAVEEHE